MITNCRALWSQSENKKWGRKKILIFDLMMEESDDCRISASLSLTAVWRLSQPSQEKHTSSTRITACALVNPIHAKHAGIFLWSVKCVFSRQCVRLQWMRTWDGTATLPSGLCQTQMSPNYHLRFPASLLSQQPAELNLSVNGWNTEGLRRFEEFIWKNHEDKTGRSYRTKVNQRHYCSLMNFVGKCSHYSFFLFIFWSLTEILNVQQH